MPYFSSWPELTRGHRRKRRIADKRRLYVARKPKRRSRRVRIPPRKRVLRWSERYPRGIQMRRHESRSARIPTSSLSLSLELGHESRARARKPAEVRTTSVARIATRCPSRSRHRAGVLIKSKRPCVIRAPACRQVNSVSSVPNTGAVRDKAAVRCGLKKRRCYVCHAPRSFSLVTMSDQAQANSIRWLIWLTSRARNIRVRRYISMLHLMITQRRISTCFVVRLNDAERYRWVYSRELSALSFLPDRRRIASRSPWRMY